MTEQIELHGGPRHGRKLALPDDYGNTLDMEILLRTSDGIEVKRSAKYTRVHSISATPSRDFEWSGFTSPVIPLREG